ncbi:hypothetical protein JCM10450v2_004190 [Rhodotorula kratochvilovae]
MSPHPGIDATATSSSSHLSSFPPLSRSQRGRIERTLAQLPHDASTWADLTQAQARLPEADRDGADEDDGMYELWLKLVWQRGVTWHDKWAAVQRQAAGEQARDPPRRHHSRRPSDNLDLLRQKLDRVALDPPVARPAERSNPPPAATPSADLESLATSFSRLRLLLPSFSHWAASARFHAQREADLTHRRATWLARCALRSWRARAEGVRALEARAVDAVLQGEAARARRAARTALGAWRARCAAREEARDEARRADERRGKERALREARDAVAALSARGSARRALETWRERARESRAGSFRVLALGRGAVGVWREKAARRRERREALDDVAAEQWSAWESKRGRDVWSWWVRRTAWTIREREVRQQKDIDLKREAWEVWGDKKRQADHDAYLNSLAASHHARRLALSSLSTWRARLSRLSSLSVLSAEHSSTLLARRASSQLTTWRLSTRLSLLSRARSRTLATSALAAWTSAYEHLEIELAGRADALLVRKGAQLRAVAFSAWSDAAAQRGRLARAAEGVDRARVLRKALGRWKGREARERVQERKADVVRDFMQTRQKVRDQQLVVRVQEKQDQRLRSNTVQAWKSRVVARKSLEQDASAFFDRKAVLAGFKRWTEQTYAAEDRLVLADEHRAVKLEELRDRAFHAWLASTRRSSTLRERLVAFTTSRNAQTKEDVYDAWREKSLRRAEREAVRRREKREKEEAWAWWKGRTKTLVAVQHYNRLHALRALEAWRAWTTPPELVLRAIETDHSAITSGALQVWRIKTGAKRALKSLSI